MPGKVIRVLVAPGDEVEARAPLVVVEAMKMEMPLPRRGRQRARRPRRRGRQRRARRRARRARGLGLGSGAWTSTCPRSTRRSARPSATSPSGRSPRSPASSTGRRPSRTRSSRKLGELGWMGIPFPEEYGGAGADTLAYALTVEELGARRLVGRDHAVRALLARHAADLPVRHRGAEAGVAAAADLRASGSRRSA